MAGSYQAIAWKYETSAGVFTSVGNGVSVKARKQGAGSDAAESPLTTNSDGEIAAGSFAALSAGDVVHFRIENFNGLAFSVSQTLT